MNTACRNRSAACDTLARHYIRYMLWLRRFPLFAALPSSRSTDTRASLFAAFNSAMAASDCFTLLISDSDCLLSFSDLVNTTRKVGKALLSRLRACMRAQALGQHGACLSLAISVQLSVAFGQSKNLDTPNNTTFDARSLRPLAPLLTLRWHPHE